MNTPQSRAHSRADRPRRFDRSWIAVLAGVAVLALVLSVFLATRFSPEGASGAPSSGVVGTADSGDPAGATAAEPGATRSRGALPPVQAPAGRGMLHVPPVTIDIPAIEVTSSLVRLGLNPDNSLEVPSDYSKAGWYTEGAYPGDADGPPALIVGHVDDQNGPAVFYELKQLEIGDEIRVERTDGSVAVFVVYDARQYPKDALPTEEIYADRKPAELVLITCTGEFDPEADSYLDNYVVTARLDPELSGVGG